MSHFVDLLRSSNTSRIMHKRASRLFDLSWNKTSPGDDGSFFLRAQVTYVSAAAAKGAHVYFLCTDTLTHDMELLFRNASLDATTGNLRHQQASPEVLRRSTLSAEAAWYIRSLFAADWALVQRHRPPALLSEAAALELLISNDRPYRTLRVNCTIPPSGVDRVVDPGAWYCSPPRCTCFLLKKLLSPKRLSVGLRDTG